MRKSQISASMMCSNLVDLQATIDVFEKEKVEYLHIDVMDGEFVPNFGLGVDYIRGLRELTSIPLDLHLMIKDPEYKLPWIGIYKEDIVTIHYESTFQVQRALDYLVPAASGSSRSTRRHRSGRSRKCLIISTASIF